MLQDGDRVTVAFSGGKDSVAVLYSLDLLKRILPVKFELVAAVFIKTGWPVDLQVLEDFCHSIKTPFYVVETEIARIVFEERGGTILVLSVHTCAGAPCTARSWNWAAIRSLWDTTLTMS